MYFCSVVSFFLLSFFFPRPISAAAGLKCVARGSHHRTTLSGYIVGTKACIDNRKNLLNINTSCTCPDNMVNFGLLTAEICWRVCGTPANFKGFWQRYCTTSSSGRQPNFAALNRGRHLYSAGRPPRWALAHISSLFLCSLLLLC